jgi:hypothetical protein
VSALYSEAHLDGGLVLNLDNYYEGFMQDIYARAGSEGDFLETVFTERLCDFLVEQAALEDYSYTGYKHSTRGMRLDAWDINDEAGTLALIVTDFRVSNKVESLTQSDIGKSFSRVEKFFRESIHSRLHQALEESAPAFETALRIYNESTELRRIKFILLSNAQLSSRVGNLSERGIEGYTCTYEIWDFSRLIRIETSGKSREDMVIDFEMIQKSGLPCLPAFTGSNTFESYLVVMPGKVIARLYEEYGERLLEQNVRTFLQFRGNVNKGIRSTLQNEPSMFFSYNNGLTATAESIETDSNRSRIKRIKNLQIVNGGQTTASLFTAARKNQVDLSEVYVQLKLTVIDSDYIETVVPKISEFANTQNKVSAADFFSNHPFHLRIEGLSRSLWAPSSSGSLRETHWFYERARGQYANAQANLTSAQQREFASKFPRSQMFTKTDLAKFQNTMDMLPHIVSLGAQKNFSKFASEIGQRWTKEGEHFNELYFKELIAKAIMFRFLDKSIMRQRWYGGYKANIITYTLAKLVYELKQKKNALNYEVLWQKQSLTPELETLLLKIAEQINQQIQNTPEGITNVTEWCKKEMCWKQVQEIEIDIEEGMDDLFLSLDEHGEVKRTAVKEQKLQNGIDNQKYVYEKGNNYWKQVALWGLKERMLSEKDMDILEIACSMPSRIPSERQSRVIINIEKRMTKEGFMYTHEY